MARQVISFKWLALTDYKVAVARGARQAKLTKEWTAAKVLEQWKASAWGKKAAAKAAKAATTDFQRFQAKVALQKRNAAVKAKVKA